MTDAVPSVLFVCVHNAGRSQLAAAFLTHLAGNRVQVRSAGSTPADAVNPAVVRAMAEVGIDISREVPKVLTTEAVQASDVVISMGCGDACPFFPGKRYLDWELPDHADPVLAIYQLGIDGGDATFETIAPTWQDFDTSHLAAHRFVALGAPAPGHAAAVVGWVAAVPVSERCVYAGVVEHSVYVHPA